MPFRPLQDRDLSLGTLQDAMNQLFDQAWHGGLSTGPFDGQKWAPQIDLYEHPEHYLLYVELPGVDASGVDVSYVGTTLTIRGEKSKPTGAGEADKLVRSERRFGTFCRTVDMPDDVDIEKLSAKCQDGVVEITIPKSDVNRPKAVKITVKGG